MLVRGGRLEAIHFRGIVAVHVPVEIFDRESVRYPVLGPVWNGLGVEHSVYYSAAFVEDDHDYGIHFREPRNRFDVLDHSARLRGRVVGPPVIRFIRNRHGRLAAVFAHVRGDLALEIVAPVVVAVDYQNVARRSALDYLRLVRVRGSGPEEVVRLSRVDELLVILRQVVGGGRMRNGDQLVFVHEVENGHRPRGIRGSDYAVYLHALEVSHRLENRLVARVVSLDERHVAVCRVDGDAGELRGPSRGLAEVVVPGRKQQSYGQLRARQQVVHDDPRGVVVAAARGESKREKRGRYDRKKRS